MKRFFNHVLEIGIISEYYQLLILFDFVNITEIIVSW